MQAQTRTFVFSANTKPEQIMWFEGFQAFFDIKIKIELLIVKAKSNGASKIKLDFSMNKNVERIPQGTPLTSS